MSPRYRSGADGDTRRIVLNEEQEARWRGLLGGRLATLHDHPVRLPEPLTADAWGEHSVIGEDVLADTELVASGLELVYASCLSEPRWEVVLRWARSLARQVQQAGFRIADAEDPLPEGRRTVVLALEDLVPIGTDLRGLDELAAHGVRSAGIAYNTGSALGSGLAEVQDDGLTSLGAQAVRRMNELGMAVDVSHASDRCGIEAAEVTERPLLITHAGARAVWPSDRMKPDEVIRAVADTGGLIGIEAAPGSTRRGPGHPGHDIDDVIAHLEHCAELVGVAHVALGPDTFYGDHVGLYAAAGWAMRQLPGARPIDIRFVAGADNPTETPRQVAAALIRRGWRDGDIAAVLGENAIRVTKEILQPCPVPN
ncbi:MAG: hypothetical protein BGN97_11050 [Microbacterium sp. 69-10]|uniref:dipeptidase n=1 Tax=Microbacterium sp. 69-10 TaxID=1895783 RepID=UPI0009610365|nr:membrane dipeptidase [Microbacterium sp. 69-10]OJU40380.1 MAG: hypothetical protein BGN97_11050 [Microbacterium sp. 69-10]